MYSEIKDGTTCDSEGTQNQLCDSFLEDTGGFFLLAKNHNLSQAEGKHGGMSGNVV